MDNPAMAAMAELKQEIIETYPRLSERDPQDTFTFACYKGIGCFNECCSDVNIFLTPYDIIRMKQALHIPSQEFLAQYTLSPFDKNQKIPVIAIKMTGPNKRCPFVSAEGCTIYADRPWACRMYPIGEGTPKESGNGSKAERFYFQIRDDNCQGLREASQWTVASWKKNQNIEIFEEMSEYFKDIILHDRILKGECLSPEKMEMFHMVHYDIDKFREFIFESSFLRRFIVPMEQQEKMQTDDIELMKFGSTWLRFCLLGEKVMQIRPTQG